MIRICPKCQDDRSPHAAKFCVQCGYPLRQPCPYGCNEKDWVALKTGSRASWRCPHCRGFYRFCSSCARLSTLSQSACETTEQRCTHPPLQETFAPWASGAVNTQHSHSTAIPEAWDNVNLKFDPLRVSAQVYGLAFRYGLLCFLSGSALYYFPCNSHSKLSLAQIRPNRLDLPELPLVGEGTSNDPQALLLDHGAAYVLTTTRAVRAELWREQISEVRGRFRWQTTTPTRWVGIGEDDSGRLIGCECPAHGEFAPLHKGPLHTMPPQTRRFNLENLIEVVSQGETVFLVFRNAICTYEGGTLQIYWESDNASVQSVALYDERLLVLSLTPQGTQLSLLGQGQELGPPLRLASMNISRHFVIMQGFVYLFDNQNHQIVRYAIAQLPARPQTWPLQANAEVIWAVGVWHADRQWLLMALRDDRSVTHQALTVYPHFGSDWTVGALLGAERRMSAAIADGQLVLSATSEADKTIRIYRLNHLEPEEGLL